MHNATQSRLLRWAGLFLFINSIILTLSPAVRERTWEVNYRLSHWVGFFIWVVLVIVLHWATIKYLPEHDPYLLPAAALLSGWGMLTIWRLDEAFGMRQTIWLGVSVGVLIFALRGAQHLNRLRQYKYIMLGSGLLITALTLIFGTNPLGAGPRLWLGCCGMYFQPSEPLKLLLVIYLSAYFADRGHLEPIQKLASKTQNLKDKKPLIVDILNLRGQAQLLIPTLVVTGLALLLLLVQRDLGTASIFIFIFTVMLFLFTGKRRILLGAAVFLSLTLIAGYFFISVIRVRVDGWLNPWADPAGQSYQIVQSLLAIANGGIIGRGLGIGSPLLVPVAISDFIFAAVAEETGLIGALGILALIGIILARSLIAALRAPDRFRRYLSAGVAAYLGVQSLLIIGGNLRLLPLTGVTLPFVSYGGSSLLTAYIALFILLVVSNKEDHEPAALKDARPYTTLAGLLVLGLFTAALATAWWALIREADLLNRTDNARRAIADRYVPRGNLLDRNNQPIDITQGESGIYRRVYLYPELAPVTGYTHPVYGQAGLEVTLDNYLRGLQGNPSSLIWWDRLLYGTPPPGLDVRLSLSLELQAQADRALGSHTGALVLMNAETGEILAMTSHPGYDPNKLDEEGAALAEDTSSPLVNRAAQGLYPIAEILTPLLYENKTPVSGAELKQAYQDLGLYEAPALNMPLDFSPKHAEKDLQISPLQMSLVAATLSADGIKPPLRIATAVNTLEQGWVTLLAENQAARVIPNDEARAIVTARMISGKPYWRYAAQAKSKNTTITWLLAGTLPEWKGVPLALVVTLEEDNLALARDIGDEVLNAALNR